METANLKLYVAVLNTVPHHMVPVLVAHSVLGAHLRFSLEEHLYDVWLQNSFKKVVLKVNQKEFDKIRLLPNTYQGYENSVLEGRKSCLVVCPRYDYPNVIKFAKMWHVD